MMTRSHDSVMMRAQAIANWLDCRALYARHRIFFYRRPH